MLHVDALVGEAVHRIDDAGAVSLEHRAGDVVERLSGGDSQACSHGIGGYPIVRDRDELIEQRERVAHRAGRLAGHHRGADHQVAGPDLDLVVEDLGRVGGVQVAVAL